jgi:hypothetical protein
MAKRRKAGWVIKCRWPSLPEEDPLKKERFITSIVTQKAIGSDDPFDIDIAKRRARCPSGFLSTQCNLRSFQ